MSLSYLDDEPDRSSWRSLEEHQTSTPPSFVDGPPILHAHHDQCQAILNRGDLDIDEDFKQWFNPEDASTAPDGVGAETGSVRVEQMVKMDVDVWITTEALVLVSNKHQQNAVKTAKIPYPAITLHATQHMYSRTLQGRQHLQKYSSSSNADFQEPTIALYLQLDLQASSRQSSNPNVEDIDGVLDLIIIPPSSEDAIDGRNGDAAAHPQSSGAGAPSAGPAVPNQGVVNELFAALNACADLWPDDEEEEQNEDDLGVMPVLGGMEDAPVPGGGRWITAENADQFQDVAVDAEETVDENGNMRILGPGAGSRRARQIEDEDGDSYTHGSNGDADETKWQRTG